MKRVFLLSAIIIAMTLSVAAQRKADGVGKIAALPGTVANHHKNKIMKDYVFILRLKAITPEIIAQVAPKWAVLVPKWTAEGHFVGNSVMVNEGHLISGRNREIVNGPVKGDGLIVLDVFRIKAENMEEALELAKQCPTLDAGRTVEVREVQPTPEAPVNAQ